MNTEENKPDETLIMTKAEWNTETRRFECRQNGLGQWWPLMFTKAPGCSWCQIIIRDSNPFKTLSGAEKFVEKTIARIKAREA